MKYLLLSIIKSYWAIFPKHKRRHCIFSESCSNYVYRITMDKGFFLGLFALRKRYYQCRPGYTIYKDKQNNTFNLGLTNGKIVKGNIISPRLLPPINYKYTIINRNHNS